MMCLMSVGAFAKEISYFRTCTAHLTVVDEEDNPVGAQDFTADTCAHAVLGAKWAYWLRTGDSSIYN